MLKWFVRKIVEYVLEELDARGRLSMSSGVRMAQVAGVSENEDDSLKMNTRLALANSLVQGQAAGVEMSHIGETSMVEVDRKQGDRTVDRLANL